MCVVVSDDDDGENNADYVDDGAYDNGGSYLPDVRYSWFRVAFIQGQPM